MPPACKNIDTSQIPPTSSVLPPRSVLRADVPAQFPGRLELLEDALLGKKTTSTGCRRCWNNLMTELTDLTVRQCLDGLRQGAFSSSGIDRCLS
jgi:hypothetical protein